MAWNEPGKDEKKDPWTGKPRKSESPPDLDALIKKNLQKLSSFFKNQNSSPLNNGQKLNHAWTAPVVAGALILLWLLSGFFIIEPASKGVILRFGKYIEMVGPGLHWIPRLIETKQVINEQKIASYSYEAQMLTKDENIVSVAIAVQYRITNAESYLFNVVNPEGSLQQATASALRQVIGHTNLDDVLTSGRDKIRQQVQTILAEIMQSYQTGLLITDVTIQPAKAPDEVKEAFDDAIKAQEDEQRIVNQAESYAMQVEPIARGEAQRLITDAKAYKAQSVLRAKGDTTRFLALLPQYQKSPNLIKTRLYFDTLELVLSKNTKIFLNTNSNQMLYLPLDKLNQSFSVIPPTALTKETITPSKPTPTPQPTTTDSERGSSQ